MSLHFQFHLMSVKQTKKSLFKDCSSLNKIETKQCMRLSYYFLKTFIPLVLKKYKKFMFLCTI